jgi:homoserine dehydrogenase
VTRLALIGYGNVARALARLLRQQHAKSPFRITGIHTARHGTAISARGVALEPVFGPAVFNLVRHNLPGVTVLGFTGALNSTSKLVIEAMERGGSFEDGLALARSLGVTEADASFDVEGWDSAAKTAALANVLMDAGATPQAVSTRGITRLTPERIADLARAGKTVRLISRARRGPGGITLRVRAEVLDKNDVLACVEGTSNVLLLHTDLMGTIGTVSISPGVEQTAYGVFGDLVDVARGAARDAS